MLIIRLTMLSLPLVLYRADTILFQVHDTFSLGGYGFSLYRERNRKEELISSPSRTVGSCGLNHGDLLYLASVNGALLWTNEPQPSTSGNNKPSGEPVGKTDSEPVASTNQPSGKRHVAPSLPEDEVDIELWKLDGKIEKQRDEKLCRHGPKGRCIHCSSIEPFDEAYLKEHNVKHLSFHAYLRKLMAGVDR